MTFVLMYIFYSCNINENKHNAMYQNTTQYYSIEKNTLLICLQI